MFMRPTHLCSSAWLEHIPFAFWMTEAHRPRVFVELGTHHGASYFAFCQAVERLGLNTRCFAVDTWKGDEHAGFYGEDVFEKVSAHSGAQYSRFSRLVRSTFDEAREHFNDGTVDLLHIDGLHQIGAVRHDFESWLPKLSERGIVMLHDSKVRGRQFGLFQLVKELRKAYPCFEFTHGHGLAVLGVGAKQNELVGRLFDAARDDGARRAVDDVFSRLGRAAADARSAEKQQARIRHLTAVVDGHKKELGGLRQSSEKSRADLNARSQELKDAREWLQAQLEQHAAERRQIGERVALLQELRQELKEDVGRLNARVEQSEAELRDRREALLKLQHAAREHHLVVTVARAESERHRAALDATRAELKAARTELENEGAARRSTASELAATRAALEAARSETEAEAEKTARARAEKMAAAQAERLRTAEAERDRLKECTDDAGAKLRAHMGEIAELTMLLRGTETAAEETRRAAALVLGKAVMALGGYAPDTPPRPEELRRLSEKIKAAGLLDSEIYLARYRDVAEAAMDPATHYLLYRMAEGRGPCVLPTCAGAQVTP